MNLTVRPDGMLQAGDRLLACALGKGGRRAHKREGDGATPLGRFALRELLWRPDRFAAPPRTGLAMRALAPEMGWCDDPSDAAYNRPVALPFGASHEVLWREDAVYDLIVPLGYNDDPVTAGAGSAIFMHIARQGYPGTEGCVALSREDLLALLPMLGPASRIDIQPPEPR